MQVQIKTFGFRIIFTLFACAGLFTSVPSFGQQKTNTDSLRIARQRAIDSARNEQKRILDSTRSARQQALEAARAEQKRVLDSARAARQRTSDSMKAVRKRITDSLTAIRNYRSSKHYRDSVATVRQNRIDSMKAARKVVFDSIKAERQRVADSLFAIRKRTTDSIKAVQKHRADSMAVIRKYRESKRFQDSVAVVRRIKLDSTREARKAISDSMIAVRKRSLDSAAAVRKHYTDSVAAVRKKYTDSIKVVRKAKSDSLAKIKENRERLKKTQEKKNEEKLKLALDLKIKKKREAWNNEKMLKKKWSVPRRILQNTYTHYNYYFNADKKMDEALENMRRMSREDYDSLLALFPFDPDRDSAKLSSDMDSIIRKASVGIQIHDPRTKWADDLYLLLGQAYYYKGNYTEASNAFRYIIAINQKRKMEEQKKAAAKKKTVDKEVSVLEQEKGSALDFLKHKPVNNKAILWLARTYTEAHKENDAESILDLIETDKNVTDELKGRIALEKAYLHLGKNEHKAASGYLSVVANDDNIPDWLRMRAAYLNAQLLFINGDYNGAAAHYQQVVDMKPKIEMDFYARKNLAYSLIQQGGSQDDATVELRKMLKDGKYIPYYEQIYYVLGRLSANSNKFDDAIVYMQKSIESPKSTRKQKALSFAGLGNVYYTKGEYKPAKLAYDSAAVYGKSIASDEQIATAIRRGAVLDNIVNPLTIIFNQDSLLNLAALPEKEQRAIIRRYIRMLEKQKEDSAFRAANADGAGKPAEEADPGGGGAANWYFVNTALMQQGFNEFKRKWGNRQNTDNWRRSGSTMTNNSRSGSVSGGTDESDVAAGENGLPTENGLFAAIPKTEEQQIEVKKRIQQAYIDLAGAYVKDMEDFFKGSQTIDTLDSRFPLHEHKAEALYLRYQIALKQDKLPEAQALSEQLRNEYADTKWAKELAPKETTEGLLASNVSVANYYDETYGLMLQRQYGDVLTRARNGQRMYTDPAYTSRFRIMEAIALVGGGDYAQADTLLTNFISTKPSDSLRIWADVILNYVKSNKPVVAPADSVAPKQASADSLLSAVKPPIPTPGSETSEKAPATPKSFTYKPSDPHYFVFFFTKMESRTMGVKAGLGDFNKFSFGGQNLSVNLDMLKENEGIIVVKSFPSISHAKIYMNSVRTNKLLLKEYKPEEYQLLMISAPNFQKLNTDRDMSAYLKFYKANYK